MKTFFNIEYPEDKALWSKKNKYLKNFISKFYNTIKDKPNVLGSEYLRSRRNKLFTTTQWDNKIFLIGGDEIFGLKSGICFVQLTYHFEIHIVYGTGTGDSWLLIDSDLNKLKFESNYILWEDTYSTRRKKSTYEDIEILKQFIENLNSIAKKFDFDIRNEIKDKKNKEKIEQEQLVLSKKKISDSLDKDKNGEIDLIENDFEKLMIKYQKKIIELDKNYIHKFVKITNYIKTKKNNIQSIFESIENTSSKTEFYERVDLLKNQVYTYELLVFHSINMISALINDELITFYEIYESFDKIGIFNSNWENEISEKINTIGNKLDDLLISIYEMENNMIKEIKRLNYYTQDSFNTLNNSVRNELKQIGSSIEYTNLFTMINTYQLYKINKRIKPKSV